MPLGVTDIGQVFCRPSRVDMNFESRQHEWQRTLHQWPLRAAREGIGTPTLVPEAVKLAADSCGADAETDSPKTSQHQRVRLARNWRRPKNDSAPSLVFERPCETDLVAQRKPGQISRSDQSA